MLTTPISSAGRTDDGPRGAHVDLIDEYLTSRHPVRLSIDVDPRNLLSTTRSTNTELDDRIVEVGSNLGLVGWDADRVAPLVNGLIEERAYLLRQVATLATMVDLDLEPEEARCIAAALWHHADRAEVIR